MSREIGFVVVTYKTPQQLLRLATRLNSLFGDPPIVFHHDFGKCDLDTSLFPGNVRFVAGHCDTGWATFGVVEGTIKALRMLYDNTGGPRWFTLLSGCDYPIKPAAVMLSDLEQGGFDAHIDLHRISESAEPQSWQRMCADRYLPGCLTLPRLSRRGIVLSQRRINRNWLKRRQTPFHDGFECYAGSQWFSARDHVARAILNFHESAPKLAGHYSRLLFSDESYFHTIVGNSGYRSSGNTWRHVAWSGNKASHPLTLTIEDLPALAASPAHFARKLSLDADPALYDALDALVDQR
ncbi:beta-1,6-N-acetylglucosaminyltransferase [Synechococcus sp. GFB01]|uniref:beta-1,6-N-acetylglucosaminyltransferase n=1 Tax=Synechococcus sp. GFB01 TaxID=1662190 RepID=UPI00064FFC95|nr:beta-1,6-N-acetylglucosaminyltransferase [Synechococcus sp. GFB01]KMM16316.1 hypothetical protein SYNGFB01_12120 [Synechococcus sp. GFB01]